MSNNTTENITEQQKYLENSAKTKVEGVMKKLKQGYNK